MFFRRNGFTLIEVLVTVSIIAILSVIAVTQYKSYILKSHRIDAINSLLAISLAEERYRSNNSTYGTLAQVWPNTTSQEGYYTLAASNITSKSYTLTASAVGAQANDSVDGVSCQSMALTASSGTISQTPSQCWPS